jgi:hypothetical protein
VIGHEARIANRTWGGQPYAGSGGGIGVRGQLQPNPSLANAGGAPGYRPRGGDDIGVGGTLGGGRRTESGAAPTRLASESRGARRLAGGQEATAADVYRSGRRADDAMPRDVSRGYDGADRPIDASQYDRGARRRTDAGGSGGLAREVRPDGRSFGEPGGTYGRRVTGGDRTGRGDAYGRGTERGGTYTGRGAEGRSAGGSRGSGYAPRGSSGGSRAYGGGSYGGGSRGGGSVSGGSRGFSGGSMGGARGGGFSGGGSRGGGGGGYRGR